MCARNVSESPEAARKDLDEIWKELPARQSLIDAGRRIILAADAMGVTLRLSGGIGVWAHCLGVRRHVTANSRYYDDIDFVGYFRERHALRTMFSTLALREDKVISAIPGLKRMLYWADRSGDRIDIFLDELVFSHELDMRERLRLESLTLTAVDLLLQKLQIGRLATKDVLDIYLLLLDHEVAPLGGDRIDTRRLVELCGRDWGLWRTVSGNLVTAKKYIDQMPSFTAQNGTVLRERINNLLELLQTSSKTVGWKLRGIIGERMPWQEVIEEAEDD